MSNTQWCTPVTLFKLLDDVHCDDGAFSVDASMIKQILTEDLMQLLNSQPPELPCLTREEPLIESSVLNYGLGITIGEAISSQCFPQIERAIKTAIIRFEPRIDSQTLTVSVASLGTPAHSMSQLTLTITAQILFYPQNITLHLAGTYDTASAKAWFE
ncbi:type VI secretion system baseplate subunit TssE [Tatumella ptyseos]|uniref:type VI secretion system baseplate subunit TssE n=1 Tax=Tatumella ptyseos TaxID=82987 RepID=UPI0026F1F8F4|nr:GPW/gp25 family protein [Tatumella ptyseos]WKX27320.1 GPW/gp25 family protein [Tatumella ptyseos]